MPAEWNDLKHKSSPEVRALLKKEAHAELERIGFDKLRRARKQTQVAVAEKLNITQGTVSHIEKQANFLLSTLKEYVGALGGHLELHAVFSDRDFILESFGKGKPARKHRRS
jgi:hypothetical protein